jgi:hypothetical protein
VGSTPIHASPHVQRCAPGTEAPRDLNKLYYQQRSSPGGLIVTECSHISAAGRGYVRCAAPPGCRRPAESELQRRVLHHPDSLALPRPPPCCAQGAWPVQA